MDHQESLTMLIAMGFQADEAESALRDCSGNVEEAANLLSAARSAVAAPASTTISTASSDEVSPEQLLEALFAVIQVYVTSSAESSEPSIPRTSSGTATAKTSVSLKPRNKTVGLCTRKKEFFAKLQTLDPMVQKLTTRDAISDAARDDIAVTIATDFVPSLMEGLIRYREPEVARVFLRLLDHAEWPIRARALYGLKMVGTAKHISKIATTLLHDTEPQIREQAASTLGHIGGAKAVEILTRAKEEHHPYVKSTIAASIQLAAMSGAKPYAPWSETLTGPEGARRVEWCWSVKGPSSFNHYDGKGHSMPIAKTFCYPVSWYKDDLFTSYPRKSFAAGGTHAGEDCAWFREGCSLYAIADGLVRMVQGAGGDWGFLIVIEHLLPNKEYVTSVYGHAAWDVLVKPGDFVKVGQKIGTQGLSTSTENGGYGSHLHFGIGYGPFRRSKKVYSGGPINLNLNGVDTPGKVHRFVYDPVKKNRLGWPRIAIVIAFGNGKGCQIPLDEEEISDEISWLQAYVPGCRGWLDPQRWLPDHVKGEWDVK